MPCGKLLFSQISAYLTYFQHCSSLVLLLVVFEWKMNFTFSPKNFPLGLEESNLGSIPRSLSQAGVLAELGQRQVRKDTDRKTVMVAF